MLAVHPVRPAAWVKVKPEPEKTKKKSYWQFCEEMTQPNKSLLMNDACPHRPWWRKRAKLDDSWGAVCAWCRTRWESSWYSSLSLSRFSFPSFRTHWQIYTKSGVLSGAVTLYKSPPSLRSHTVTLKMARPNALPLSFSTFPPLSPSSPDSLSPSPALFLASPSLWAPLYFRQKQSLYFPSHCPALPQSETLIAGRRREGEGWE